MNTFNSNSDPEAQAKRFVPEPVVGTMIDGGDMDDDFQGNTTPEVGGTPHAETDSATTVSIPLTRKTEEEVAHFFANEWRTYHPVPRDRASEGVEYSLHSGTAHSGSFSKPTAAFRHAVLHSGDKQGESIGNIGMFPAPSLAKGLLETSNESAFHDEERVLSAVFEKDVRRLPKGKRGEGRIGLLPKIPRKETDACSYGVFPFDTASSGIPALRFIEGELDRSDLEDSKPEERTDHCNDPQLRRVIEVWPTLSRKLRSAIMAIVR